MITDVWWISRDRAETLEANPAVGMISITNTAPPDGEATPAKLAEFGSLLRLEFDDVTYAWQGYIPMSKEQAAQIVKWVKELPESIDSIWIHCEAGISRSAAVGLFLCETFNIAFDSRKTRFYNDLVYKLLNEAWED